VAEWDDIERLRANTNRTPAESALLESLLDTLAARGDREAAAQRCVERIDAELAAGAITKCEAFARAMECFASTVGLDAPLSGGDRGRELLSMAWNYLVKDDDQDSWNERDFLSPHGHDRRRKGGFAPPAWTNTHGPEDADESSGYLPPRGDDPEKDKSARMAHFLANATITYRGGRLGDAAREMVVLGGGEASTTDKAINRLGGEFGHALKNGDITSQNIAEWIRRRMCKTQHKPVRPDDCPAIEELLRQIEQLIEIAKLQEEISAAKAFLAMLEQMRGDIQRGNHSISTGLDQLGEGAREIGDRPLKDIVKDFGDAVRAPEELEAKFAQGISDLRQRIHHAEQDLDAAIDAAGDALAGQFAGLSLDELKKKRDELDDLLQRCYAPKCRPKPGRCAYDPCASECYAEGKKLSDLYAEYLELRSVNEESGLLGNVAYLDEELRLIEEEWKALQERCCSDCGVDIGPHPSMSAPPSPANGAPR
jgi:hypothetical protein